MKCSFIKAPLFLRAGTYIICFVCFLHSWPRKNMNKNQTTCLFSIKYKPDYTGRQKCPDGRAQTCLTKVLLVSQGRKLYLKKMHTRPFSQLSILIPPPFSTSVLICMWKNERKPDFFFFSFFLFFFWALLCTFIILTFRLRQSS